MSWHPTRADLERYAHAQSVLTDFDRVVARHAALCPDCRATTRTVRAAQEASAARLLALVVVRPPAITEAELARDVRFAALLRTLEQGDLAGEDVRALGAAGEPPVLSDDVDPTLAQAPVRDRRARRRGALERRLASGFALRQMGYLGAEAADLVHAAEAAGLPGFLPRAQAAVLTDAQVLELEPLLRDLLDRLPSRESEAFLRWFRDRRQTYGDFLWHVWRDDPASIPDAVRVLHEQFLLESREEDSREAETRRPTR